MALKVKTKEQMEKKCMLMNKSHMLLTLKVFLYLWVEESIVAVVVLDDATVFEKRDARTDVEGVGEVVGGHDDGGMLLTTIGLKQVLHGQLRGGIQKVKGLIEL